MTTHTHRTAPTQYVEANGVRFAYRRFGNAAGVPLVFNQHFTHHGPLGSGDRRALEGARSHSVRRPSHPKCVAMLMQIGNYPDNSLRSVESWIGRTPNPSPSR